MDEVTKFITEDFYVFLFRKRRGWGQLHSLCQGSITLFQLLQDLMTKLFTRANYEVCLILYYSSFSGCQINSVMTAQMHETNVVKLSLKKKGIPILIGRGEERKLEVNEMGDNLNFQKIVARYFLQEISRKRALSAKCERLYYYYFNSVKSQTPPGHLLRDKANIFISISPPPPTSLRENLLFSVKDMGGKHHICVLQKRKEFLHAEAGTGPVKHGIKLLPFLLNMSVLDCCLGYGQIYTLKSDYIPWHF